MTTPLPDLLILILIGGLLTGYALLSKGFAYLGSPPLFIGDATLGVCLVLFLVRLDLRVWAASRVVWVLLVFCAFCLARTVPYLETYGLFALRDGVVYGYCLFALLISCLMARRDRLRALPAFYEAMSLAVILLSPAVIILAHAAPADGETVPLIFQKAGDLAVHLSGAAAFRLVGLRGRAWGRSSGLSRFLAVLFWSCWLAEAVWVAAYSRGGLLTIAVSMAILFTLGYQRRGLALAAGVVVAAGVIGGALQLSVRGDGVRAISADQIFVNSLSILDRSHLGEVGGGDVDTSNLQANSEWRLRWWGEILDDTVFGEHFWSGRGFGINLATLDGFQIDERESLRSPHSVHMTILARAGVPGLMLWLLVLGVMATALVREVRRMGRLGLRGWHALITWVLVYWTAALVNGSFDVYIEGPQGGIWFWSLTGLGIAVVDVVRRAGPPVPRGAVRSPGTGAGAMAPAVRSAVPAP